MENDRYRRLGAQANAQAQRLKEAFLKKGFPMLCDTVTNQIFPILPNDILAALGGALHVRALDGGGRRAHRRALLPGATTPPKTWRR
jgi:threonine aldolase